MKARMYVLVVGGALVIYACGGGDNTGLDGGSDATNDSNPPGDGGGNKDGTTGNDGSTNDGSANDGGDGGVVGDGGTFACGTKTCNSATDYCEKAKVGPDGGKIDAGLLDGGVTVDNCLPYPVSCTADGGSPSCSCIGTTCGCTQSGSDITVTCP